MDQFQDSHALTNEAWEDKITSLFEAVLTSSMPGSLIKHIIHHQAHCSFPYQPEPGPEAAWHLSSIPSS